MAKDKSDKITRIDVRIPNDIYQKIEAIAIDTNQPVHHRSGKPVVTPIILNLINLGLESIASEDFNLESLTDKQSGTNRIREAELENKILASIEQKLEVLVENKIKEVLQPLITNIESDINPNFTESIRGAFDDNEDIESPVETEASDSLTDKVSDNKNNDLVKDTAEGIKESKENKNISNDKKLESGRIRLCFSYEEAVEEIKRLNQEGLSNSEIANELRDRYYTKRGSTNWSRQQIWKILKEFDS